MQCVQEGDKSKIVALSSKVSIQTSLVAPTLKTLEKKYGLDDLASLISMLILQTASYLNLSNNINEDQSLETAFLLLEKYPHETIDDFIVMFKNAKKGEYGEIYNRLDGQLIFKWMEKYLEEKADFRNSIHQKLKFSVPAKNLITTSNSVENSENSSQETYPVEDALKKAIDYKEDRVKRENYQKFKAQYLAKKVSKKE